MIISRNNYEEYFLLYVDNELKQEERAEVEKFVEQNPDLQQELKLLQQTALGNDDIKFNDKELLYKSENSISLNNYEEYFLLSVDNELNNQQLEDVEKFILKHPQLQDEYTSLEKTKLQPESIEFKNKEVLYKKESRVIPISWMRLSAVASVLAIIAFAWVFTISNKNNGADRNFTIAKKPAEKFEKKNIPNFIEKSVTEQPVATLKDRNVKVDNVNKRKAEIALAKESVSGANKAELKQQAKPVQIVPTNNKDNYAVNYKSALDIIDKPAVIPATVNANEDAIKTIAADRSLGDPDVTLAKQTVYREIDNVEEDNSIYLGSTELNKNKVRGLLKKAASLFDRKADTEDEEKTLRIAVFRIKSK